MIKIIGLGEVGKLPMLQGRQPETTEAERISSGAFVTLSPERDGYIFCEKFSGDAAWERHPSGDELVQVVDGAAILYVVAEDGPLSYALSTARCKNLWHRFRAPDGVKLVTATPKPTEHDIYGHS